MRPCFQSSWLYTSELNCWVRWQLCNIWGTAKLFSKEFAPFKIPTSDTGGFHLPQFDVSGYEVVSHCSFNLRFSNDSWCGASSHVSIGHLHISGEVSVQILSFFFLIQQIPIGYLLYIWYCKFLGNWFLITYEYSMRWRVSFLFPGDYQWSCRLLYVYLFAIDLQCHLCCILCFHLLWVCFWYLCSFLSV